MPDVDWDLIVIGAGAAGLSAAVSAADEGASVLVLESEDEIGGSTMLSAGMFTAAGTSVQSALGIEDSWQRFYQHYMDLNGWRLKPGLIRSFCQRTGPTLEWLLSIGVEIPAQRSTNAHQPGLTKGGVEDVWRGHVPVGEGHGLVTALNQARLNRNVELILRTRVQRLLFEDGVVRGVVADDVELSATSVLVSSGGLTRDPELLASHYPDALKAGKSLFVVSASGSRGDHIRFGEQVKSALGSDKWGLQLVTAYFQNRHHWEAGFPPASRFLVDRMGHRFVDEDAGYNIAAGVLADRGGYGWMIFDEKGRTSLPSGFVNWTPEVVLAEVAAGRTYMANEIPSLARAIDVPEAALVSTTQRWNDTLPIGLDPDFFRNETLEAKGKTGSLAAISHPPFYAVRVLPTEIATSHTGLLIDEKARVLDSAGLVIPGLFAAGEASGGILGPTYVGSGNAIASAIVFGRAAGLEAAARR